MLLYFSNCPLYISSHAETQYSPGSERFPFRYQGTVQQEAAQAIYHLKRYEPK